MLLAQCNHAHKCSFNAPYHFQPSKNEQFGHSLDLFVHDYRSPDYLVFNGA